MGMTSLADVRIGGTAHVIAVTRDDAVGTRILEMGLVPGAHVVVHGTAPFGDPIELEVCGYRLSLRKNEASCIEVRTDD